MVSGVELSDSSEEVLECSGGLWHCSSPVNGNRQTVEGTWPAKASHNRLTGEDVKPRGAMTQARSPAHPQVSRHQAPSPCGEGPACLQRPQAVRLRGGCWGGGQGRVPALVTSQLFTSAKSQATTLALSFLIGQRAAKTQGLLISVAGEGAHKAPVTLCFSPRVPERGAQVLQSVLPALAAGSVASRWKEAPGTRLHQRISAPGNRPHRVLPANGCGPSQPWHTCTTEDFGSSKTSPVTVHGDGEGVHLRRTDFNSLTGAPFTWSALSPPPHPSRRLTPSEPGSGITPSAPQVNPCLSHHRNHRRGARHVPSTLSKREVPFAWCMARETEAQSG